jgi:hypothetical protein
MRGLYLTYDRACEYLRAAGVDPSALMTVPFLYIQGAQRVPLQVFNAFDVQGVAMGKTDKPLPNIRRYISLTQKSRHR